MLTYCQLTNVFTNVWNSVLHGDGGVPVLAWDPANVVAGGGPVSATSSGFTVRVAGDYRVTALLSYNAKSARVSVGAQISRNQVPEGPIAHMGYIRNASNHRDGSTIVEHVLQGLQPGDTVEVFAYRMANRGTATALAGRSKFSVERIR